MNVVLLLCAGLKAKPKLPPSMAQVKQQENKKENVWKALKSIFSKRAFPFVMCSYGLNIAPYVALVTVLNTIISVNFPVSITTMWFFSHKRLRIKLYVSFFFLFF